MRECTPRPSACVRRCRQSTLLAAWIAAASLVGCDLPTVVRLSELPRLDTRWILPAEETRLGVADLLPNAVQLTTAEDAFVVNIDPLTFSETLGGLCAVCIVANGLNVPKPPFTEQFSSSVALPSEVSSFTLVSGDVDIQLHNGTNFDVLRPAAGAFGEIEITVTDGADGDVLGTLTIDGTLTPFPAGTNLMRVMTLAAATVQGPLAATVEVDSPLGDFVTIDITDLVSVTVTPTDIVASSATIDVAGRTVSVEPVDLDVGGIDDSLVRRIEAGGVIVDVINPFGVSVDLDLTIDSPAIPAIVKSVTLEPTPTSTFTIAFTTGELRSFLGEPDVVLTGSGLIDPAAGQITVSPGEELVLMTELDITLRLELELNN